MTHPYLALEHPVRLAHRGSRVLWPENTMTACAGAVGLGYRYIETDVRITRDGVPVAFHDATLERVTNGKGRVDEWNWEDLRHLDAAWSFGEAESHPLRGTGLSIPRLDDLLAAWPDVHFNLDVKQAGLERRIAELMTAAGRHHSVLVGSFSDRRVARFRRITRGEVATAASPSEALAVWGASRVGRTLHRPAAAYQVPFAHPLLRVDRRYIEAIHAAGAQVHAWTVNRPADMERLLALGVDGIVTDRPDLLNEVIAARAGGDFG